MIFSGLILSFNLFMWSNVRLARSASAKKVDHFLNEMRRCRGQRSKPP